MKAEAVGAHQALDCYFGILQQFVICRHADDQEAYLAAAFELGRSLVDQGVPPDEVTGIHHEAILRLAECMPGITLDRVAERMTRPLLEMSMAYGLAFRAQMEKRFEQMVEARLEQSRKLEAVGTLAAGIAHDFNNILGSIVGFAEMAGDELAEGSFGKQNILQVLRASFRARDLVSRLLSFARRSPVTPVHVDVVTQVGEALALLRASLKPDVHLSFQAGIERAIVLADPTQIQQIVMNLCINAADAMDDHGTVDIRLMPADAPEGTPTRPGRGICLSVADSGHGMPPEVQSRVFDPFFTTKAPNKGSGLGLSVVYGIVTEMGGGIEIRSKAGGMDSGTEFRVFLPIMDDRS